MPKEIASSTRRTFSPTDHRRQRFDGFTLVSDPHLSDQAWLERLFEAEWSPASPFTVQPVQDLRSLIALERRDAFDVALEELRRPHGALGDAQVLAELVQRHARSDNSGG